MLESRKTAVALEEEELVELQRIIIDRGERGTQSLEKSDL